MGNQWDQVERRRYVRIERHFIISYYDKNDPDVKHNISQLKNISMGGMCFIASQKYDPNTKMGIELKTPFLAAMVHVEGTVLESREKAVNLIYETRLAFDALSKEAEIVLKKIVETFQKIKEEKQP